MRGRAFGFVAILCATWVTARIGFTVMADRDQQSLSQYTALVGTRSKLSTHFAQKGQSGKQQERTPNHPVAARVHILALASNNLEPTAARARGNIYAQGGMSVLLPPDMQEPNKNNTPPDAITSLPFMFPKKRRNTRLIQIYAYSFWRRGDAAQNVLGNGQYGGGQSAILATIPLLRFSKQSSVSRLALIGRASVAHDDLREREYSAGVRWQPMASVPAHVTVENRFRHNRPDAIAAFVAGGHQIGALPMNFTLDAYGQAGIVTGTGGGGFGDVQMQMLKPVTTHKRATLSFGAGAWAGGQSEVMRVDIGPSVRAGFQASATQLRLDASWRFRVAGNARPGNGPAVTLSTSF
jgi:hypothetical protein